MSTVDRTRQAIIEAAILALGEDPRTSLGDVASRAGVGRTTLHRHFPDRAALIAEIDALARERFVSAALAARTGDGTGWEAMARLLDEYFDLGDLLALVFADAPVIDPDTWDDEPDPRGVGAADTTFASVVHRGQTDGTIDPELTASWCEATVWMLLYVACRALAEGTARTDARALLLRTVRGALGPKAADGAALSG